jgi:membrane associated rhomboid family serine protease
MQWAWPPWTLKIRAITVFFFFFWLAVDVFVPGGTEFAHSHFVLSTENIAAGRVWVLLTYAFWHQSFLEIFFVGFLLWGFGGEFERRWSRRRFWISQVLSVLSGGLVVGAFQWVVESPTPYFGYHVPVMFFVTAFCLESWSRRGNFFLFQMTGRTLLALFLGLTVVLSAFSGHYSRIVADLTGVAVAYALTGPTGTPSLWNPRYFKTRWRLFRARRRLRVVPSDKGSNRDPDAQGKYIH